MLQDINPYDQKTFEFEFKKTDLYRQLSQEFDEILFSLVQQDFQGGTPRQHMGDRKCVKTRFSAVPFYFLNWLLKFHPEQIYDLGCGWNIFKRYIPNIIGVGAEDPNGEWFHADIHDYVDDDYVNGHQNFFESMFSICALHSVPLSTIRQRMIQISTMIKPQGHCYLSFNLARLYERDRQKFGSYSEKDLEMFVRKELSDLPFTVLVFCLDFSRIEAGLEGNIHIVFQRP